MDIPRASHPIHSKHFPQKSGKGRKLSVQIFNNDQVFVDLAEQWKNLAIRADAPFSMSYEWTRTWWKYFGRHPRRTLYVMAIWDGSNLVGLAPLYKGTSSFGTIVTERRYQLIGMGGNRSEQFGYKDDYGTSDFLDILVDENYREPVAILLCEWICSGVPAVDRFNFYPLREDSFVMQYLYPRLKKRHPGLKLRQTDTCPYIDLRSQTSFNTYIKSTKANARRRFRQTLRSMGPGQPVEVKEIKTRAELEQAAVTLISLHQKRWNRIGFPGIFYDQRFIGFFKEILHKAYDENMLWLKQARDHEGVCAVRMLFFFNGRYFDYVSGFDDQRETAKNRPGIGLLLHLVDEAIQRGATGVELLRGEEPYKYDFTSASQMNWNLEIDIREKRSFAKRILSGFTSFMASLYTVLQCELQLMNVQRIQKGLINMLPGYVRFRWHTLKLKLSWFRDRQPKR